MKRAGNGCHMKVILFLMWDDIFLFHKKMLRCGPHFYEEINVWQVKVIQKKLKWKKENVCFSSKT